MTRALATLYRLFYDGVLSRLPEPLAISLGQTALRLLPLDRLPFFRLEDPRLAVTLGGVRLPNPLILAAQYYDATILRRAMGLGFGAVTAKSITRDSRPGHPQPNLVRVRSAAGPGLVNCNGFQNPGLTTFRATLERLPHRVPLIVSVAGESAEDNVALVETLGPLGDLVEFNISSPNTALVYAWSERPRELRAMLEAVRTASRRPLIVKISPDFADANERSIIPAALEAGITIINYGNTRRIEEPRLSQATSPDSSRGDRSWRGSSWNTCWPAASKGNLPTAYPLVHHYPQPRKSHGVMRPRGRRMREARVIRPHNARAVFFCR